LNPTLGAWIAFDGGHTKSKQIDLNAFFFKSVTKCTHLAVGRGRLLARLGLRLDFGCAASGVAVLFSLVSVFISFLLAACFAVVAIHRSAQENQQTKSSGYMTPKRITQKADGGPF
jgi:hypothetical protein